MTMTDVLLECVNQWTLVDNLCATILFCRILEIFL